MSLHLSVSHSVDRLGVSLTETPLDSDPSGQRPHWTETPPPTETPSTGSPLSLYGKERVVSILLECILVYFLIGVSQIGCTNL